MVLEVLALILCRNIMWWRSCPFIVCDKSRHKMIKFVNGLFTGWPGILEQKQDKSFKTWFAADLCGLKPCLGNTSLELFNQTFVSEQYCLQSLDTGTIYWPRANMTIACCVNRVAMYYDGISFCGLGCNCLTVNTLNKPSSAWITLTDSTPVAKHRLKYYHSCL